MALMLEEQLHKLKYTVTDASGLGAQLVRETPTSIDFFNNALLPHVNLEDIRLPIDFYIGSHECTILRKLSGCDYISEVIDQGSLPSNYEYVLLE